jgi:hypothetical protein
MNDLRMPAACGWMQRVLHVEALDNRDRRAVVALVSAIVRHVLIPCDRWQPRYVSL